MFVELLPPVVGETDMIVAVIDHLRIGCAGLVGCVVCIHVSEPKAEVEVSLVAATASPKHKAGAIAP